MASRISRVAGICSLVLAVLASVGGAHVAPATASESLAGDHRLQSPAPTRPNVIVINADDMRADSLAHLSKVKQWLVDAGTSFPNAYVSTPSCCPSRATLMSGRYVHNNGQYQHLNRGLDLDLTTQRYLRDAGYFTGHVGKFVHWWPLDEIAPHWDRWTYFDGGYTNVPMNMDGQVSTSNGYSTTIAFNRVINYLDDFERRNDAKPFYIQIAPIAPHRPSTPEQKYATAAVPAFVRTPAHDELDRSDKPPWVRSIDYTLSQATVERRQMIRTLYSLDDQVARLMQALQARGELANTIVILTSDNGYMWGEHRLRSKFLPYKEAVNVPMVIRWPGRVAAGATDASFVTHIDVLPTILAATGVSQNRVALDGKNILGSHNRNQAFTEYYYDAGNGNQIPTWAAIRTPAYLYVEYYGRTNATSGITFREYYDMRADPYQLRNLLGDASASNDPDVATLSRQLAAHKSCAGTACG